MTESIVTFDINDDQKWISDIDKEIEFNLSEKSKLYLNLNINEEEKEYPWIYFTLNEKFFSKEFLNFMSTILLDNSFRYISKYKSFLPIFNTKYIVKKLNTYNYDLSIFDGIFFNDLLCISDLDYETKLKMNIPEIFINGSEDDEIYQLHQIYVNNRILFNTISYEVKCIKMMIYNELLRGGYINEI